MSGREVSHDWVVHPRGAQQLLKQAHRMMLATVKDRVRECRCQDRKPRFEVVRDFDQKLAGRQ